MIRSMTGFGRHQQVIDQYDVTAEIKSVNHRYYEFSARMPRQYGYLDEKLKGFMKNFISRGKVEVSILINNLNGREANIKADVLMASGYLNALREINSQLNLEDDIKLSNMLRLPDIFNVQRAADDEDYIGNIVRTAAESAAKKFVDMREAEGEALRKDLLLKIDNVSVMLREVERLAPLTAENYREKLHAKLLEVLEGKEPEPQRILTEAAIYAEKIATDEETVRLNSHLNQFKELLEVNEPVGRKLDFLVQEINREINTIGSKASDLEITKYVVDMKAEVEKIREQIQNIE